LAEEFIGEFPNIFILFPCNVTQPLVRLVGNNDLTGHARKHAAFPWHRLSFTPRHSRNEEEFSVRAYGFSPLLTTVLRGNRRDTSLPLSRWLPEQTSVPSIAQSID
jgi:hypothetical protein